MKIKKNCAVILVCTVLVVACSLSCFGYSGYHYEITIPSGYKSFTASDDGTSDMWVSGMGTGSMKALSVLVGDNTDNLNISTMSDSEYDEFKADYISYLSSDGMTVGTPTFERTKVNTYDAIKISSVVTLSGMTMYEYDWIVTSAVDTYNIMFMETKSGSIGAEAMNSVLNTFVMNNNVPETTTYEDITIEEETTASDLADDIQEQLSDLAEQIKEQITPTTAAPVTTTKKVTTSPATTAKTKVKSVAATTTTAVSETTTAETATVEETTTAIQNGAVASNSNNDSTKTESKSGNVMLYVVIGVIAAGALTGGTIFFIKKRNG